MAKKYFTDESLSTFVNEIKAYTDESVSGKANSSHTHTVANITDLTATATELNYMDGVTSNVQTQLDGKASSSHTHNYAGSSSAGGAATSANKLSTARTIAINGRVSGSTSFDGSGNVTITTTDGQHISNKNSGAYYIELGRMVVDDSSNFGNITIAGRIGGWEQVNSANFEIMMLNRSSARDGNTITATVSASGEVEVALTKCDIVIYRQDDTSNIVYLKTNGYWLYDFDWSVYQHSITYTGSTSSTTPSGTLIWSLSTAPKTILDTAGNLKATSFVGNLTGNADTATSATTATQATQDASGNVITDTYATKTDITALQENIDELKSSSGGSTVAFAQSLTEGTTIGTITIDGTATTLYAPAYITSGVKSGTTIGVSATAEGFDTTASGSFSHAEGHYTTASGDFSHAEGSNTTASGRSSHAEGYNTTVTNNATITAQSIGSYTAGYYGHAEGYGTVSYGCTSHAEGNGTTASGSCSHAEGERTTASGDYSHAEGYYTTASGSDSHAEGFETTASGMDSHAEGDSTTASGRSSHAEGVNTTASGTASHAGGYYTIANGYQYVVGKYNADTTAPTSVSDATATAGLFIVGIGTSSSARSNGFRINPAGKVYGTGTFGTSGADYAEYFEWFDGNPNNEDRRGRFVTLDGDKIRYATPNDDYILGVVSADPSVVGDIHSEDWHNKYLKDIYGSKIVDVVEVEETTNEFGEIVPAHTERRWVLNPDYDPDLKYTSREERPEWAAIGIVGKIVAVDDGTCQVNGYCYPNADGIATASQEKTNYRVMERLDDTHIRIFIR